MARISIIIPVYNVKDYIKRCLDFVAKQTVTDFECILVDDGSTDGSDAICEEYANKDKRFILAHSKNGGPGGARNIGLNMVTSPWLTFIDSDDYVDDHYLDNFLRYNERDIYTQVIQGYHCMGIEKEDKDTLYTGTVYTYHEETTGRRSKYIEENNLLYNWAVWCKVFSMDIIRKNNIRFDERLFCSEDGIFWHEYLCHVNKLIYVPERGYTYYCPRQFNSVSRGGKHIQTVDTWLAIADDYKEISNKLSKKFCLSKKYASFLKMLYWNNYFRALIKPKTLTDSQLEMLKSIKPSRFDFVLTKKGIVFWIINLLQIKLVRVCRSIM